LANPPRDAQLIAEALKDAGFDKVIEAKDLKLADFKKKLEEFKVEAASAQVALVYFAGHGVEVDRRNYLVPVDAAIRAMSDVDRSMLPLDAIKSTVHEAKRLKMIVLDACRDDPFAQALKDAPGLRTGLANPKHSDNNLVIVYAASEGQVAEDGGQGENSPFAQALATRLATPGMEIDLLLRNVHDDVRLATDTRQSPAIYATLSAEPFYFIPPPPEAPSGVKMEDEQKSAAELELEFWKAVTELDEADLYQVYLDKVAAREFKGTFTALAKRKVARAGGAEPILAAVPARKATAAKAAPTPDCVAGAKLDVLENGTWYPSTAKGKNAEGRCEISYDGFDAKYDEAVGPERMRAHQPPTPISAEDKARLEAMKPLIAQAQQAAAAKDYVSAAQTFEKAARAGAKFEAGEQIASAAALLSGTHYLIDDKSPKSRLRAARMFRLAAQLGQSGGAVAYAYMLRTGHGVAKDEVRARGVLKPFAEKGDGQSMAQYGQMLMAGQGGSQQAKLGRQFIQRAAEAGNATGMRYHADHLRREQGDAAAAVWYRRAAEKDDSKAMLALGRLLLLSKDMPRDEAQGKQWLTKAADQMEEQAMFELAQIYVRDPKTQAEGAKLAGLASAFGNPEHRLFYARLLEKGIGVPQDIQRARAQYEVLLLPNNPKTNRYYRRRAQLELADLRGR
jgi:TPR repeat protein